MSAGGYAEFQAVKETGPKKLWTQKEERAGANLRQPVRFAKY